MSQLRIIAGKYKGRRISFKPNSSLRPSTNRSKETLFNWLMVDIEGSICLDMFAGTGSLGIEAISRGAVAVSAQVNLGDDAEPEMLFDMGQITSNDVVILISLSGQSEELKNIIQYTSRNKNITLIGVTSKKESILYKNSDIKFLLPSVKEADPGNIVPTSSTTIQSCATSTSLLVR